MQSTWTWSQVITNLKGITAKTSGNTSQSTSGKWGVDTTNGMWMYIPSNAYYSTGHWLNVPWNTCKGVLENVIGSNLTTVVYHNFCAPCSSSDQSSSGLEPQYSTTIGPGKYLILLLHESSSYGGPYPIDQMNSYISLSNGTIVSEKYYSNAGEDWGGEWTTATRRRIVYHIMTITTTVNTIVTFTSYGIPYFPASAKRMIISLNGA